MYKIRKYIPSIHKDGYIIIAICFIATILIFSYSPILGAGALVGTSWCVCFFRDPNRNVPQCDHILLAPADGTLHSITTVPAPGNLNLQDKEMLRISIFLSVFDVHVNRLPITGTISSSYYHPGKFINASLQKSSEFNERNSIAIETKYNKPDSNEKITVVVTQVAGLIARRIVCHAKVGNVVTAGQRYGIIRFGSRVDLYVPRDTKPLVRIGQKMIAGETILANLSEKEIENYKGVEI